MIELVAIGGPRDGEWLQVPDQHAPILLPGRFADGWAQTVYRVAEVYAGPGLATRAGARTWRVLVHTGTSDAELDVWLSDQGGPAVTGPMLEREPDLPCNRCPMVEECSVWRMRQCLDAPMRMTRA